MTCPTCNAEMTSPAMAWLHENIRHDLGIGVALAGMTLSDWAKLLQAYADSETERMLDEIASLRAALDKIEIMARWNILDLSRASPRKHSLRNDVTDEP